MPVGIFAAHISNATTAVALISVVLFGFQMWISNVQTLPSDCFPAMAVGSVAGAGGAGGAGVGFCAASGRAQNKAAAIRVTLVILVLTRRIELWRLRN